MSYYSTEFKMDPDNLNPYLFYSSLNSNDWTCTDLDCANGKDNLVYGVGGNYTYDKRCLCLNKNEWGCPTMTNKDTNQEEEALSRTAYSSSVNERSTDPTMPCYNTTWSTDVSPIDNTTGQKMPAWKKCVPESKFKSVGINCQYSSNVVPKDFQVKETGGRGMSTNLLLNYCFSKGDTCPSLIPNCPKALSNDIDGTARSICTQLQQYIPLDYDARIRTYCDSKTTPSDIKNSGCQCSYDLQQTDGQLQNILTGTAKAGMSNYAHCLWKPCLPSGNNFIPYSDLKEPCNQNVTCGQIINISDKAIVDGEVNQNLICKTSCSTPCGKNERCDESIGKCVSTIVTTKNPVTTSSPINNDTSTPFPTDTSTSAPIDNKCKKYEKYNKSTGKCDINIPVIIAIGLFIILLFFAARYIFK